MPQLPPTQHPQICLTTSVFLKLYTDESENSQPSKHLMAEYGHNKTAKKKKFCTIIICTICWSDCLTPCVERNVFPVLMVGFIPCGLRGFRHWLRSYSFREMFWADSNYQSVMKANMDGTRARTFNDNQDNLEGVTVDVADNRCAAKRLWSGVIQT